MPRCGEEYRQQLKAIGYFSGFAGGALWKRGIGSTRWQWQKPPYPSAVRVTGQIMAIVGSVLGYAFKLTVVPIARGPIDF